MKSEVNTSDADSVLMQDIGCRRAEHQRNALLEERLLELKALLEPVEHQVLEKFESVKYPALFIVGNPRSGTTVFLQFLQMMNSFCVPTNVISRFYYAPYIGSKIQQLLYDPQFDFRDELKMTGAQQEWDSSLGKTSGPLAPSEILHLWRRFLPHYDPQYIAPENQHRINTKGLSAELAAIESVFDQPLALKAFMLQYNMPYLMQCAPQCLIVRVKRDPFFIAQSILMGRENHYGSRKYWWSLKPPEYEYLKDMDVYYQIAGQVYFTEKAIEEGLQSVPETNQLTLEYESFCANPEEVYLKIVEKYAALGCTLLSEYKGPESFVCSNEIRISDQDVQGLRSAYAKFKSGMISFEG